MHDPLVSIRNFFGNESEYEVASRLKGEDAMRSFASKSSLWQCQLPYLAACILTSTALACGSDDSDAAKPEETQANETEAKQDGGDESVAQTSKGNEQENADAVGPESTPEAQAARDEAANPGSAAVTRFDGDWQGTTSQDKPVSIKILNRFVAHAELSYALEGDGCKADAGDFKFSAMTPTRMGAFSLMNATDTAKLTLTGKFTSDDAAEGEYTVEVVGDAPAGCNASVAGTWTASK